MYGVVVTGSAVVVGIIGVSVVVVISSVEELVVGTFVVGGALVEVLSSLHGTCSHISCSHSAQYSGKWARVKPKMHIANSANVKLFRTIIFQQYFSVLQLLVRIMRCLLWLWLWVWSRWSRETSLMQFAE